MSRLFELSVIEDVRDESAEPIGTTNAPTYAIDARGRRWVRKSEASMGVEGLIAEAVGWLLGRELGVPIPDGGIATVAGELSWLSARRDAVVGWSPQRAFRVRNLSSLGNMLVLDAIILNDDRNDGNVILEVAEGVDLHAWAIDHADAGIGHIADAHDAGLAAPSAERVLTGLPLELVTASARAAAQRASNLPDDRIDQIVAETARLIGGLDSGLLLDVLRNRCRAAPPILNSYLAAIGAKP